MRHASFWMVRLLILLAAGPALLAQDAPDDANVRHTATVPESNEAMLLASQAEQAVQNGEYRLALGLISRLFEMSDELVMTPGGRTLYPVWDQAARMYGQLPQPAVELYRQLNDAETAARFEEARRAGDLPELETLFRRSRASQSWPAIGEELAQQHIERGRYADAIDVIRALVEAGAATNSELRLMLVVALQQSGATAAAQRVLERIDEQRLDPQGQARERLSQLREWLAQRGQGSGFGPPADDLLAAVQAQAADVSWSSELEPMLRAAQAEGEHNVAEAVESSGKLPLYGVALDDDTLAVRLRGTVWAFDALTLMPRWRMAETAEPANPLVTKEAGGALALAPETRLLLENAFAHAVAVGGRLVFTIEGTPPVSPEYDRPWGARFIQTTYTNELVARDVATGEIAWRTSSSGDQRLSDVAFQAPPLHIDGALCVPVMRGETLWLCRLETGSGKLLNEVQLIGPPTRFPQAGGRCQLLADETTIYIGTGNGVIAAVRRDDFRWKWAALYPSTLSAAVTRAPWGEAQAAPVRDFGAGQLMFADELLVAAPADSETIFALDRFSGRQRWPALERQAYARIVGVVAGGLVVGGNQLTCLSLEDGQTIRWRSVALQVTGRGATCGEIIYVPTNEGIVALDGRTGKLVRDGRTAQQSATLVASDAPIAVAYDEGAGIAQAEVRTAALLVAPDALIAVTPNRVVKLAAPAATRQLAERALKRDSPAETRGVTALAWATLLAGDAEGALRLLERIDPNNEAATRARDELMTHAFVALALRATDDDARIDWLGRAATLKAGPRVRARVNVLMGQALERNQRWKPALLHHARMLGDDSARTLLDGGAGARIAGWLYAADRLGSIAQRVDGKEVVATLNELLADARPAHLFRLRYALPDNAELDQEIRRRLAMARLPYELLATALPADDPELPQDARRQMHLARWMTHVALGELEAARADRDFWEREFAGSSPTTQPATSPAEAERAAADESDRLRRVRDLMTKLEQVKAVEFTGQLQRHWRQPGEFICERDGRIGIQTSYIAARDARPGFLRLRSISDGYPWRTFSEALNGARLPSGQPKVFLHEWDENETQPVQISHWPAAAWGYLAAAPVERGLVAFGLGANGPDRLVGARLWELPVAEWASVAEVSRDSITAGPLGVCILQPNGLLVMAGWVDGQPWWERSLRGVDVESLHMVGERLVVVARDARVLVFDALRGKLLGDLPGGHQLARLALVAGNRIVFCNDELITALDAQTLQPAWTHYVDSFDRAAALPGVGALAIRGRNTANWTLLDLANGATLLAGVVPSMSTLTGAARFEDGFLLCGQPLDTNVVQLSLIDGAGVVRWETPVSGAMLPNATQLSAHPRYLPLLSLRQGSGEMSEQQELVLTLVDKPSGAPLDPQSLNSYFKDANNGTCQPMMIATPERLVVQWKGALVGLSSEARP